MILLSRIRLSGKLKPDVVYTSGVSCNVVEKGILQVMMLMRALALSRPLPGPRMNGWVHVGM